MKEKSVLFACNMNSVRSPMAEAIARQLLPGSVTVSSCGVYKGYLDPFVQDALKEAGIEPVSKEPREFAECEPERFDVVIALTAEAAGEARKLGARVEFWDTENPTDTRGSDDELRAAYARVRDTLMAKIRERFSV